MKILSSPQYVIQYHFRQNSKTPTINKTNCSQINSSEAIELNKQIQISLRVVSTLKKASEYALNKEKEILSESKKHQENAQELLAKILNSAKLSNYTKNGRFKIDKSGYLIVKFNDEFYSVKIGPDKVIATQKTYNLSRTSKPSEGKIYEFNPRNNQLSYFAQGVRKKDDLVEIEKEYFYSNNKLKRCNVETSNYRISLAKQRFDFTIDEQGKEKLFEFSSNIKSENDIQTIDRIFRYKTNGKLSQYAKGYSESTNKIKKAELLYEFDDNENLKKLKKEYIQFPSDEWQAKIYAKFKTPDLYCVCENYKKTKNSTAYSIGYIFENGKIKKIES